MLKKQSFFLSIALICLLFGQAAAISENQTSLENELITLENKGLISSEYNELTPPGNNSSGLFSLAPLNPDFEEYLENEEQSEDLLLFNSGSEDETENQATGFTPAPVDLSHMKYTVNLTGTGSYPVSYDLRTLGLVSPVRNQMDAGSCWTFGACAALESYLLKTEGINRDLSENNIKNTLSENYPEGFDRSYDDGGNAFMTTAYFARWSGPVSETDDPYDPHSGVSPTDIPSLKHIQEVIFLPERNGPEDNDMIKWALMNYGAVDSEIYVSSDTYDTVNYTYYYEGSSYADHIISIVGWDDSFDRNKFTPAAPGDGAFIIKNSWGTSWGEEGFFYVSYYDTVIGTGGTVHTVEDVSTYSHVYQYDSLGWVESIGSSGSNTAWAANVFTAEENETLEAVSFYTPTTNTSYEIYIYTDPVSGPLNSAGADSSASGTITFAGYHTVPLNSSVPLEAGKNFSVVVKFTTPGYSFPVAVELPQDGYSSKATANSGESFFSLDGENWIDTVLAVENTNVCIKAFTNRSEAPEAAFTSNVTSGPAPLSVEFIDASTLSPTSWYWDFGDGNTSTERFPTHNYTESGKYNVTLRVENEYGNSTIEKTEWVSVTGSSLIYVDDDGSANFTSIQEAVDAASPGATIIVRNGTYTENVDVDRAVTILSESGPEYTEVKAAKSNDSVFYVTADAVNISGFSISGGSELASSSASPTAGIWLYCVKDCNISENIFSGNLVGLYLVDAENCTLDNNSAESNSDGIYLKRGKGITLEGNIAESNDYGIRLLSSEGTILRNNSMENNSCNFAFVEATTEQDIDESNTVEGKPIYYLVNESDLVLDSDSSAGTVYCIDCRNVTVRNLNLSGNYYGLYLYNTTFSHVENVSSSGNIFGFYVSDSSTFNFTDNSASSNYFGVCIIDSEWESISGNCMDGNTYNMEIEGDSGAENVPEIESGNLLDGKKLYIFSGVSDYTLDSESEVGSIYLLDCQNITIRDLVLQNGLFGIYQYGTEEVLIENTTLSGNYIGVYLENSGNSTIEDSEISGNYCGAYFENSGDSTVKDNEISGNYYGVFLPDSSGNTLENNTLTGNSGMGVYLTEAMNNTIISNNVSGSYAGFYVIFSDNNTFVENIASGNYFGFYLLDSDYNKLTANTVNSNSGSGLYLELSQHNTLSENTVSENTYGVILAGWNGRTSIADNVLYSNTIDDNSEIGMWLVTAENNTIYENSFNNTKNVRDAGRNIWNTTIGNSWSDYTGSDADGDGVGDTPYVINSMTGSKDYLPVYGQNESSNDTDESEQTDSGHSSRSHSSGSGTIVSTSSVLTSSVSRQQVVAGQQAEFTFSKSECSVTGISFVAGVSAGTVAGKVEVLSGLPNAISEALAGEPYQYMSIVIGSQFFGESGSFENAVIDFKVSRSWVEENNIDEASLVLNRYHDDAWAQLSTEKTGEDDEFLYFRAETPGFSYYSITGDRNDLTITPEVNGSEADAEQITGNDVEDATTKKSPGFGLGFTVAGILSVLCLLKKRQGKR